MHTLRQELAVVENSTKMTFESALRESERSLLRAKHEQERSVHFYDDIFFKLKNFKL